MLSRGERIGFGVQKHRFWSAKAPLLEGEMRHIEARNIGLCTEKHRFLGDCGDGFSLFLVF
jgi:hypothetical protein